LNFDNESFSKSLCKAQFQSRAIDVATVYRDEESETDELQRAKKHAFDIIRRQKNRNESGSSGKRSGRVRSLRKDLFSKSNNETKRAVCRGEKEEVHEEYLDTTLATVNMTGDQLAPSLT